VTFYLDDKTEVRKTDSNDYYLDLDPQIFFGGGDNFVITKGQQYICVLISLKNC
jgi:hypothetical protein